MRRPPMSEVADYAAVNANALRRLPGLLARWLPDGKRQGREWVARNPRRTDRRPGSFKINVATGAWADFATGDRGRDVVSLLSYIDDVPRREARRRLAAILGA